MKGGETSHHLGAVGYGLLTVESSLRTREALADDTRVLVDSRGRAGAHEPAAGGLCGSCPAEIAESTHPVPQHSRAHERADFNTSACLCPGQKGPETEGECEGGCNMLQRLRSK